MSLRSHRQILVALTVFIVLNIPTIQLSLMREDSREISGWALLFLAGMYLVPVAALGLWKLRRWAVWLLAIATLSVAAGSIFGWPEVLGMAAFPLILLGSTFAAIRSRAKAARYQT